MKTSNIKKAIKAAARQLVNGDPQEAVSSIDLALGQKAADNIQKILRDAKNEADYGSPEKAEHMLDMALDELNRKPEVRWKVWVSVERQTNTGRDNETNVNFGLPLDMACFTGVGARRRALSFVDAIEQIKLGLKGAN